ncbi:BclA C-terminal domain-containing protein [Brevibacillus reuszeri]|uniref:BclA C-terminal domain-containing protein n=1 Tax=Brevibacillus reuszeri TaxID=54915 RepID=UPI00289EAF65|nr:hypothetical protein [Brevibacillus reuszeri]
MGADIPFSDNNTLNGASHSEGSAVITVSEAGEYKIDFELNYLLGLSNIIAIRVNGDSKSSTILMNPNQTKGSVQLSLNAGDSITLQNAGPAFIQLASSPDIAAKLEITKVN